MPNNTELIVAYVVVRSYISRPAMSDPYKPGGGWAGQHGVMDIDLARASTFMTTHARLIDRRRFELVTGQGRAGVLPAVAAYRNDDGGYGWGLEPDLRSAESQPVGALHAFEAFAEVGLDTGGLGAALCDWLASVTLPDGGLPFALPIGDPAGSGPWWLQSDPSQSSLHITSAVAGIAHRVARHDPAVRDHEWLARATDYCRRGIAELGAEAHSYELGYVLQFLDATHDVLPAAPAELQRLVKLIPDDAALPVEGGVEGEALHLLDFSSEPGGPLRALLPPDAVGADLARLAAKQQDDGGWVVDFPSRTAAGALEWRGYATVNAVKILLAHR
jgi:hypothetical protein